MQLDLTADVKARAEALNQGYKHHSAFAVMARALDDPAVGDIALVSSFGAESVVLLHMLSVMDRTRPVLFIDTQMLFAETIAYQNELAQTLGLSAVQRITPDANGIFARDVEGDLHRRDPDACCALRKSEPLETALMGYDAWITGRKRYQSGSRAALEFFEVDAAGRLKVNPLAHWDMSDVQDYITNNRLPRHPLVAQGYPSIGCAPCTGKVAAGEDPRAGRWRGREKTECGIHFAGGRAARNPAAQINNKTAVVAG